MPDRDQQTYTIDNFRGFYSRSVTRENVPPGYLAAANNLIYIDKSVKNRSGFNSSATIAKDIVRWHFFRLSTAPASQRSIFLTAAGDFFDPAVSLAVPILTIATATDFSILTMFDRVYISPHNRVSGTTSQFLYVYEPLIATTARLAAGSPPTTAITAVTSATPGTIQAGIHLFAVACETASGFITTYKTVFPGGFPSYLAPGGFKADLTVPFGDPGTTKRHILATKRISSFDGNAANYEFFFIDVINDNVTPGITVDFVDSQLVESADFLLNQLELIPAFVQLCTYQGCVVGVGEAANRSIARISKPGEPESFQSSDGFVIVNPGEGGGLKNCTEYRGTLIVFKSFKTYSTINNGGPPNTWPVTEIDSSFGTECFGLGRLFDDPGSVTNDALVVATRGGVYAFDGSYASRPLSFVIESIWNVRDLTQFSNTQVFTDPINKIVYISYFDSTTLLNSGSIKILTMDFSDGLNWESVRWSGWFFPIDTVDDAYEVRSIGVTFNTNFLPKFSVITNDIAHQTMFFSDGAATDPTGASVQSLCITQPISPDDQPNYKLYQGGKFVSEGTGTILVVDGFGTDIYNVPDTNLPGLGTIIDVLNPNGATYAYLRNVRTDYIAEAFLLTGAVSLNKVVFGYKPDLDEIVR